MHEIERHGDVTRVRLWSRLGAAAGYDVSIYIARGVLIDTGFPRASRELARLVSELNPAGAMVTHWHEDHAGNCPLLARLGVPLAMSDQTFGMLRARSPIRLYRRLVWGRPSPFPEHHQHFTHPSLSLLHTPGHSDDHHVIWDAERRTLFSGDLWLGVRARVMHEHEEPHRIVRSLRRVAELEPRRMFDAHRGLVGDPRGAIAARITFLEDTIGEIERALATGRSERQVVREVLGGEEFSALVSLGEYARRNFVRAVQRAMVRARP
jgi:endoribonuclease LACTB2